MQQQTAKYVIALGLFILVVGVIWYFWGDKFRWIGRLPGDIRIEKENFRFYFPITTLLLISLAGSLILRLLRKWF